MSFMVNLGPFGYYVYINKSQIVALEYASPHKIILVMTNERRYEIRKWNNMDFRERSGVHKEALAALLAALDVTQ